jgi:hypothetical protein
LDQALTAGAGPFAADVALDGEYAGLIVELFSDVFTDALEGLAALRVGAGGVIRLVVDCDFAGSLAVWPDLLSSQKYRQQKDA